MTQTKDLLIEIGCEDLPARFVRPLGLGLAHAVSSALIDRNLACDYVGKNPVKLPTAIFNQAINASELHFAQYADAKVFDGLRIFSTPRRIALKLLSVADIQQSQTLERKGPKLAVALKDGQPTAAGLGFAKTCGVEFSQLAQEDGQLVFRSTQAGRKTVELVPEIFEDALKAMDALVPKRMRWGAGTETFVRPVEWLTVLFGEDIVPIERFGLRAGRLTCGHRFHAPDAIALTSPAEYESTLKVAKVWADFVARRAEIGRQIEAEAAKLGGIAKIDEALLDEVTALVEWPVVISGRIEERFLELPPEVIVATVETNQRYFTVFDATGKLLPAFITVANIESKDVAQVISGNERVVRPRLSDALFFWQQDLRQPLDHYEQHHLRLLEAVTFQKELGSIASRCRRLSDLAHFDIGQSLAKLRCLTPEQQIAASQATAICKFDLVTKMVYEFPELQGLMGGYYAAKGGEPEAVCRAIAEHYRPTQAGGPIPSTIEGRIVALADKLDTLAGIFAIGQKPTASKDPFALRRAALGVLRILIEGRLPLDLSKLLADALGAQPANPGVKKDAAVLADLTDFVFERLRSYYAEQDLPPEMFEAVKALGITVPTDFDDRVQALRAFWSRDEAKSLSAAHKRIRNILKQAGHVDQSVPVDTTRFAHPAENALLATLERYESAELAPDDYVARLAFLAEHLRAPVDAFFDMRDAAGNPVMVNDPDPALRANRLALLRRLDAVCREVADISLLPG